MIGMIENNVENVKVIGRREMNMDSNMKETFYDGYGSNKYRYTPYFNDAKELFGILIRIHFRKTSDCKQK